MRTLSGDAGGDGGFRAILVRRVHDFYGGLRDRRVKFGLGEFGENGLDCLMVVIHSATLTAARGRGVKLWQEAQA